MSDNRCNCVKTKASYIGLYGCFHGSSDPCNPNCHDPNYDPEIIDASNCDEHHATELRSVIAVGIETNRQAN